MPLHGFTARKSGVPPCEKSLWHLLRDEFSVQKVSNHLPSETFAHGGRFPEGDVNETAIGIEAAFQNDSVDMGIPSEKLAEALVGQDRTTFDCGTRRLIEELLQHGEDEDAEIGEERAVMAEEHTQHLGNGESEYSMGQAQQELIGEVFGEQEGALLGA